MNRLNQFATRFLDPWRQLARLEQDLGRAFSQSASNGGREYPAVNVFVRDADVVVTTELPGIDAEKLDITVMGDTVTLRGERAAEQPQNGEAFHRRERPAGTFARTVQLPFEVDASQTEAQYEKGVLRLKFTRPESTRPKKVTVKAV